MDDNKSVSIHFRCADFDSLKAVGNCAVAANVTICLGDPDGQLCYEGVDAEGCPFYIFVENDCAVDGPPSVSEIFGVYLARDLKRKKLIAPEISDGLQSDWNAVPL